MKISEATNISMPAKNLLAILAAVAIGTTSYFGVIERLNRVETNIQLMQQDMEAANSFISGVPKGTMVSPQVNELYMLVEWLSTTQEELRTFVNTELPDVQSGVSKNDMTISFIEERLIDAEQLLDKLRSNGATQQ